MRILILRDEKINDEQLDSVLAEFSQIFKDNANITPEITKEYVSYRDQRGSQRAGFDALPYGFVKWHVDRIHKRDKGRYDHILLLVHRANFKPTKAIWGENFSNFFYDYHVSVGRYDHKNPANSLGTIWHEVHHSLDALVETELGVKVEPLFNVKSWDNAITHGGKYYEANDKWDYIRHKENQESLARIAFLVQRAYDERKRRYLMTKVDMLKSIVELMKELKRLKRVLFIKHKNKCHSQ